MLFFLAIAGAFIILISAGITLIACMASARMSEGELGSEAPLSAEPHAPHASRATRFSA